MSTKNTNPTTFRIVTPEIHRWAVPLPSGDKVRSGEPLPQELVRSIVYSDLDAPFLPYGQRARVYHSLAPRAEGGVALCSFPVVANNGPSINNFLDSDVKFRLYTSEKMPYGIIVARTSAWERDTDEAHYDLLALDPYREVNGYQNGYKLIESVSNIDFLQYGVRGDDQKVVCGRTGRVSATLLELYADYAKSANYDAPFTEALRLTLECMNPEDLWNAAELVPAE